MDEQSLRSFLTEFGSALVSAIKSGSTSGPSAPLPIIKPFCGRKDDNLTAWLFQITDLFDSKNMLVHERLKAVSAYLGEGALQWYLNTRQAAEKDPFLAIKSWDEFKSRIKSTFDVANSPFSIRRRIRYLRQDKSVLEFTTNFRGLVGQINDMNENDQILNYIEGLQESIRNELIYRQPKSLNEAIELAQLYEAAKEKRKYPEPISFTKAQYAPDLRAESRGAPMEIGTVKQGKTKARCAYCRMWGHSESDCRKKKTTSKITPHSSASMVELDDDFACASAAIIDFPSHIECNGATVNSLIILAGTIENISVKALLDSGASHNFISESFAQTNPQICNLIEPATSSAIHAVDGAKLKTVGRIASAKLNLGSLKETINAYVIPIEKYDIIVGKPWLTKHNPIIDWRSHRVEITHLNQHHVLKGIRRSKEKKKSIFSNAVSRKELSRSGFLICANVRMEDNSEVPPMVTELIHAFPRVFQPLKTIPPDRETKHRIETGDSQPVAFPYYRMSPAELESLKLELDNLIEKGFIRPSKSPWASPVLFVRKKDGSLRLCVDYRALNNLTVKHKFPIPRVDDLLDQLSGAMVFSKLDLASGYYQIAMEPQDIAKTAFRTKYGQYEFTVMPFGLTNAPATFQSMMNDIFKQLIDKFVVVYLDDIMIFSKSYEEHAEHLTQVLEILDRNSLVVKKSKCSFYQEEIEFLGFRIRKGELLMDEKKVEAINSIELLDSIKDVRSFLGLTGFYRRFIEHYSDLATPLTELLKSDRNFSWSEKEEAAFQALKKAVTNAPVLTLPRFDIPFQVTTDASGYAVGAVLSQELNDGIHPVAFESRKLSPTEKNYAVHELELLSIVHALKTWRCYLEGKFFTVYTDHASLQYLKSQKLLSRRMARWMEFLSIFNFDIKYKPGKLNLVADALSRIPSSQIEVNIIERTDWPTLLPQFLSTGAVPEGEEKQWEKKLEKEKENFVVENETIYYLRDGTKVPFCPFVSRLDLVEQVHAGMGHLGGDSTYSILKDRAWWPQMQQDVKNWVASCDVCQRYANDSTRNPKREKLHPMEPPVRPFSRWGLDFVGRLPVTSRGNKWIIVAIDHFTRWPVARPVPEATSNAVANFLYENIVCDFGCPDEVLSDRGSSFMSEVMKEYLSKLKIKHLRTTAYHPRTNGMVERLNGSLVSIIRKCAENNPHSWDLFINEALLALRIRVHSTTGISPFFLTYGVNPKIPGDTAHPQIIVDFAKCPKAAEAWREQQIQRANEERQEAYNKFIQMQAKSKEDYDKLISKEAYNNNELVYLKKENRTKFDKYWTGPYRISQVVGNGTYKLATLTGDTLNDYIHGDRLKAVRRVTNEELQCAVASAKTGGNVVWV